MKVFQKSFWEKVGIHKILLHKTPNSKIELELSNERIYQYIIAKFNESIKNESYGDRIVFYHEYIVCFSQEDYTDFYLKRKGVFLGIVVDAVNEFYNTLRKCKNSGKNVQPFSSNWVFRFTVDAKFQKGDLGFIGSFSTNNTSLNRDEDLKITIYPKGTNISKDININPDILKHFKDSSVGFHEIPFRANFVIDEKEIKSFDTLYKAKLEVFLPESEFKGQKIEYFMRDDSVVISGKAEKRNQKNIFVVPSEWVDSPHINIKYDSSVKKFYVSSFGEKTILNEKEISRSEPQNPQWFELPINSRIMLNGIVGINIFNS